MTKTILFSIVRLFHCYMHLQMISGRHSLTITGTIVVVTCSILDTVLLDGTMDGDAKNHVPTTIESSR